MVNGPSSAKFEASVTVYSTISYHRAHPSVVVVKQPASCVSTAGKAEDAAAEQVIFLLCPRLLAVRKTVGSRPFQ